MTSAEDSSTALVLDDWTNRSLEANSTGNVPIFQNYPPHLLNIAVGFCVLFISIGVPGNLITMTALMLSPRLKNATTPFIINLCIGDFLYCAFSIPLTMLTFWNRRWVFNDALCKAFPFVRYISAGFSIFSVIAIAVNRYILIVHPNKYKYIASRKGIYAGLATVYLVSLGLLSPPLFQFWGTFGYDKNVGMCSILPLNGKSPKAFLYGISFILPSVTFIICYPRVYYIVRVAERNIRSGCGVKSTRVSNETGLFRRVWYRICCGIGNTPTNTSRSSRKLSKDLRLLRMILVIFSLFLLGYIPLVFTKVLKKEKALPIINIVGYISVFFVKCINPVVYVVMSKEYRQAYRDLFSCIRDSSTINSSTTKSSSLEKEPTA